MSDYCQTCERYDKENNRQRNIVYCTFECKQFQEECMMSALAWNAMTGDYHMYGIDGTVIPNDKESD